MKQIPVYKFFKHKYGDELLVDIVDYDVMRGPLRKTPVCSYTFYAITLVLDADEAVGVNGRKRHYLARGIKVRPPLPRDEGDEGYRQDRGPHHGFIVQIYFEPCAQDVEPCARLCHLLPKGRKNVDHVTYSRDSLHLQMHSYCTCLTKLIREIR